MAAVPLCRLEPGSANPPPHLKPTAPAAAGARPACPHCGHARVVGRGSFVRKDGTRVQRYACKACSRSFNPTTGTPEARLRKRAEWELHKQVMTAAIPLRRVAVQLGVHLTTAFRWRHLFMQALCGEEEAPVQGSVALGHAFVPYSEKGSRSSTGPGSYYSRWGRLKRGDTSAFGDGPESRARCVPGAPVFRYCIDARPTQVLLATNGNEFAMQIAGNGKPTAESLMPHLSRMLAPGASVLIASRGPYDEVCRRLGFPVSICRSSFAGRNPQERRLLSALDRLHGSLGGWLLGFHGVATRYLHRYLAWLSWIIRRESSQNGA